MGTHLVAPQPVARVHDERFPTVVVLPDVQAALGALIFYLWEERRCWEGERGGGRGKEGGEKRKREKKGEERKKGSEEGRREGKKRRGRSEEKGGESSGEPG